MWENTLLRWGSHLPELLFQTPWKLKQTSLPRLHSVHVFKTVLQPQQLLMKEDVLEKVLVFKTTSCYCLGFSFSLEESQWRRKNEKQNLYLWWKLIILFWSCEHNLIFFSLVFHSKLDHETTGIWIFRIQCSICNPEDTKPFFFMFCITWKWLTST